MSYGHKSSRTWVQHPDGGYRFLPAIRAYSGGVVADDNHEICHVRLRIPWKLDDIEPLLPRLVEAELGQSTTAICGLELRSPKPMSYGEFAAFNRRYTQILSRLGMIRGGINPVARTNVVPTTAVPTEPVLVGLSLTMPASSHRTCTFVLAGAAESQSLSAQSVIALGETSPSAMNLKAEFVIRALAARLDNLEAETGSLAVPTIYCAEPPSAAIVSRSLSVLAPGSSTILYCASRPPVAAVSYEMDLRQVAREIIA